MRACVRVHVYIGLFFSCVNLIIVAVHAELVYTIGDEISFISFMTDLRRKLAEHPDSEDILGGHKDPNLSETGDHPVLAKQRADEQRRGGFTSRCKQWRERKRRGQPYS